MVDHSNCSVSSRRRMVFSGKTHASGRRRPARL